MTYCMTTEWQMELLHKHLPKSYSHPPSKCIIFWSCEWNRVIPAMEFLQFSTEDVPLTSCCYAVNVDRRSVCSLMHTMSTSTLGRTRMIHPIISLDWTAAHISNAGFTGMWATKGSHTSNGPELYYLAMAPRHPWPSRVIVSWDNICWNCTLCSLKWKEYHSTKMSKELSETYISETFIREWKLNYTRNLSETMLHHFLPHFKNITLYVHFNYL